jgi:CubicO group peptidase (beta-lactamase class C family)
MRAIVIVHAGHLVGERYAEGFGPGTRQLGCSMTKSVTAGLIGILVKDGRIKMDQSVAAALHWLPADPRAKITVGDLMSMSSGLHFDEADATVSDLVRML